MSTEVTNETTMPAHPAKGNLQGQTTLAAKIDRWTGLNDNLTPLAEQMPQFRDQIFRFQSLLSQVLALRARQKILKGDYEDTFKQRDALFFEGDDLFSRLSHALRAVHGPTSSQLRHFGLKPRKNAGGRPRKQQVPTPPPPQPEIHTSGPVPGGEAPGATPAPQ